PTGSAVDIALGDMDADGDLDFIVARGADENGAGQSNTVWLNNSEGNFVDSGRRLGRENSASAEVFDVDDDGDLDIVFGNLGGYNETWLNASNATFTLKSQDSFDRQDDTYHVALADFGGSAFNYFEANSFPDPSRHGSQNLSASEARRAAIGDLNRDGKFDVILATVGNQANQVWLLTSPSELTQRTADNFSRDSSNGVALADLDYDGDLDVIFANAGENSIYLQVGSPGGSADKLLPPRPVPRGDDFGNIRAEAKTLAAPIEGQSVSQAGRINFDGDVDVFLLPLIAGHQYEIDTDSTTVSVRVDDPVDRKVSGYTVFTAERSGTYAVQVSGRVGNYTLTAKLADNDHGASKRSATPLPFASSQTGVLVYGSLDETDYFSVDKIMNTSIQIVIDSPQAHLINARLAYSAGASVANADLMLPTRLMLTFKVPESLTTPRGSLSLQIERIASLGSDPIEYRVFAHDQTNDPQELPPTLDGKPGIKPGDANRDGLFDSADLVALFAAGQYEDGAERNSVWDTGDFDGDREFTTSDLILAFALGSYQP
ncbi:MAG: VCBS repeat-containing protein, partial [Planctomycetales bacterium]|nr:VCBS repeat-containing protein [Planctomycetales bacterium]